MPAKAVALFSGGLDSALAVRLIADQGIQVRGLTFVSSFNPGLDPSGRGLTARLIAHQLGMPLRVVGFSREHLDMVQRPRYGLGRNMNPCIDCHTYMCSRAREWMEELGADFVFTGEVLGERPMSQRRQALDIVESKSGLRGRLLRPLSAKLLPPTIPEREGLVDRDRLLDIRGRSRKRQIALAAEYGLTDYPTPAGGCLLTDPLYSNRLREVLEHGEDTVADSILLRLGRHFRLGSGAKVVIARDQDENGRLMTAARPGDVLLRAVGFGGPVGLLRRGAPGDEELAGAMVARYGQGKGETSVPLDLCRPPDRRFSGELAVRPADPADCDALRVE